MKIVLVIASKLTSVDTGDPWAKKSRRYSYAPTTLTTLAALVPPEMNAQVEIVDECVQVLPENLDADLVGISTMTANAPRAYQLADRLRVRGIPVVLGGYHPTALPEEALQHADAVVLGYAEESWPRLLQDFANQRMQPKYQDGSLRVFQSRMPFARRDLLQKRAYALRGTIETTRGCRNRCEFCVIPLYTQSKLYHRPIPEAIEEIKQMKARWVTFLDPSPTEDMEYAKELCRALIPLKIRWHGSATLKAVYDREWLELAHHSGCRGLLIGFESVNQEVLNRSKKAFNRVNEYVELVRKLHEYNVIVFGCFVFGLDGDDCSVFGKTLDFVNESRMDLCQYATFTPLPGSPVFEQLKRENRIIETDWSLYDCKHVVFQPSHMSKEDLETGIQWVWKKTYFYSSIFRRTFGSRASIPVDLIGNIALRKFSQTFVPRNFSVRDHDRRFLKSAEPA